MLSLLGSLINSLDTSGSFLPLTLEQLAREHGTLQHSHLPCWGHDAPTSDDGADNQCMVSVLGLQINTASFAMYTFSVAVLIQALTLVSFSALADYGMTSGRFLEIFLSQGG